MCGRILRVMLEYDDLDQHLDDVLANRVRHLLGLRIRHSGPVPSATDQTS